MERIWLIVDQLEEAKRLLSLDKVSFLRMSLLLLDNAVEVLMYRKIMDEFALDELYATLDERAKISLPNEHYEQWKQEFNAQLISAQKKNIIKKFFNEKIKFLCEDRNCIKEPVAKVLSAIHRYRNEAYHRDHIRKETLQPVVVLLFEIACDLLVELPPHSYRYTSGDDWSEYFLRYELPDRKLLPDGGLKLIADKLKAGVSMDLQTMKDSLKKHIKNRLEDTLDNVKFIMRDGFRINSLEEALKRIQFIQEKKKIDMLHFEDEFKKYTAKYDISNFTNWAKGADEFDSCINKYNLFNAFSSIEEQFEPIENNIQDLAIELDRHIQMEIDIARGK